MRLFIAALLVVASVGAAPHPCVASTHHCRTDDDVGGKHAPDWAERRCVAPTGSGLAEYNCVCLDSFKVLSVYPHVCQRTATPTNAPTNTPTHKPTETPTAVPTYVHTGPPTNKPTPMPTAWPTRPTAAPTSHPTRVPSSPYPTRFPTGKPTHVLTEFPTSRPTTNPTSFPTPPPTLTLSEDAHVCHDFKCTYRSDIIDGVDQGKTYVQGQSWSREKWECERTPGTNDCVCICDWTLSCTLIHNGKRHQHCSPESGVGHWRTAKTGH